MTVSQVSSSRTLLGFSCLALLSESSLSGMSQEKNARNTPQVTKGHEHVKQSKIEFPGQALGLKDSHRLQPSEKCHFKAPTANQSTDRFPNSSINHLVCTVASVDYQKIAKTTTSQTSA